MNSVEKTRALDIGTTRMVIDPRLNQHFGLTAYTTMFTRFHNIVTDKLQEINPEWSDEVLYQEARKFVGALNQIIVYRDYLPILLGIYFFDIF